MIRGALLEDVGQHGVLGPADAVDQEERVLALRQVLAVALVGVVRLRLQVEVVVQHLEVEAEVVDHGEEVELALAEALHDADGQAEEAPRLARDHVDVLLLGRADAVVPPVDVQALASVQFEHLRDEHLDGARISKVVDILQRLEIDVVGGVESLRDSIYKMGYRFASPKLGIIFNVIYHQAGVMEFLGD
eukprot:CAMPEP_0113700440 /NCGR_PEP_ID=MMETSP0038_2-20120614/23959_1 /TAXON_ID=2898 /ORGANISM="Cryptomonas paramecium" /LENGTH=189 /DNA_ID=CAMNT_0000624099 /DNA_START=276 /DNA_END=845 /DNA_ORIENTATION=- /assembly_acc=CAM_ASM_000170